ncbi:PIN domain-containing protein [Actinoallomurus sp. CA-150999]|uniref:PIN domain-containing protein n=1 Tax=Actinoallomurus sp. CA-150999 TaxID=3239887 RepID=UPI003D909528
MRDIGLRNDEEAIAAGADWVARQVRDGHRNLRLADIDRAVAKLWPQEQSVSSATDPANEQALHERLAQLPPVCAPRILAAWRDEPTQTWRLVTALTSMDVRPTAVVAEWEQHWPTWLVQAAWQVQVAAAELAAGYGAVRLAADLFMAAAAQGASRRGFWLARAAILYDENDYTVGRSEALDALGRAATDTEPYARAVAALLAADTETASRELAGWSPDDMLNHLLSGGLRLRLAITEGGEILTRPTLDRSLQVLAEVLRQHWSAGFAIIRARLLVIRARRGESPNWDADLREAGDLALRARNEQRAFRGNSAEAAELACQVAVLTMDPGDAITLGTVSDDGATADEAASPLVHEYVAMAAMQLGNLDLARDRARHVTDQAARARLEALLAEADGLDPGPHWQRAIELAGDNDEHLAQALVGLAGSGAEELPRFEEFQARHPEAAVEIRALSELAAGKPGAAITRLRALRRASVTAALHLAQAYQAVGNVDDQVRTLRDAAEDFHDPSLRYGAAEALTRAGRASDAERELEALLASTAPDWNGRSDALRLAAQLAYNDRRYERACELLQTAMRIEPDHTGTRWALIRVLIHRGDLGTAWRVLSTAPQPLEPPDVADAQRWIQLYRRYGRLEETVAGCLRLLRRFGDSEQFSAFVVTNLMIPNTARGELPDDLRADARLEMERFFDRWPASPHLRRLRTADMAQLLVEMSDMVRPSHEEQLHRHHLARGLILGKLPLSLLAAATGRSYAEILIRRSGAVIPARYSDPAEIAACAETARTDADEDVVIDTAAVAVLLTLPLDVRQTAIGIFARVVTTDDALRDALAGKDSLALRSTDTWAYDEGRDVGRFDAIPQAEADRLAEEAESLLTAIEALARYPRPATRLFDDLDAPALIAWASIVDLAIDRKIAVWSDDPILRAIVRESGLRATSTPAVLDHLAHHRTITAEQYENAIRTLIKTRVSDMPFNEQRLLELAEDEGWAPRSVAVALSRPAAWANAPRAASLFGKLIVQVRSHQPMAVPSWLYLAVRGAAAANPGGPAGAVDIAARLLAFAIHAAKAQAQSAADLVTVTRDALVEIGDSDLPPGPDPLPACAVLLRDTYAKAIPPAMATRHIISTFAALPKEDREEIVRILLR